MGKLTLTPCPFKDRVWYLRDADGLKRGRISRRRSGFTAKRYPSQPCDQGRPLINVPNSDDLNGLWPTLETAHEALEKNFQNSPKTKNQK